MQPAVRQIPPTQLVDDSYLAYESSWWDFLFADAIMARLYELHPGES